jgi:phosphopantothenoylcysteine synthetase/decarboxylase
LSDSVLHIDLRNWADICVVAPLSAHTLSKIANGLCDDLLTCILRAWDFGKSKPVVLAPAMNTAMWDHPLTTMHLNTVKNFGGEGGNSTVVVVQPIAKTLACGEVGVGALAELDDITFTVENCLKYVIGNVSVI